MPIERLAPPLTKLQCQTAIALAYRLAVDGFEPDAARKAVETYIGRKLANVPCLYSECRWQFRRGQQRRAERARRRAGKR